MKQETRICQNCKNSFIIEPEDFAFYGKMQVPPPTWCPECRMIRRFAVRNETNLYRVKDAVTGKEIFSGFPAESGLTVYEHDYWWSDVWDPMDYGRGYDFSRPFFEQVYNLMQAVPVPNLNVHQMINSAYSNNAGELKNCYLCFNSGRSEDSAYIIGGYGVKNSFDLDEVTHSELCYEGFEMEDCYQTFYSISCDECRNVWFSRDCTGCFDCVGCVGLRNKKYHIFNTPYAKEDYFAEIEKMNLGSYAGIRALAPKAAAFWASFPYKFLHGVQNVNVSGDFIHNSKNVRSSYNVDHGEDLKFCQDLGDGGYGGVKDSYDFHNWGDDCELIYESRGSGYGCKGIKFCVDCWPANQDLEYSTRCGSSTNLFGCVGLRKKSYCILNKQYSKEEYAALRGKIIAHMNEIPYQDKKGRIYVYGEFFPSEFSPYGYNETIAHDFFPLTRKEAEEWGYGWREMETREYQVSVQAADLPDNIKDADESILQKTIGCAGCRKAFRIIPIELSFLKSNDMPLPRLCVACRRARRLAHRNPPKFYSGQPCHCAGSRDKGNIYQNAVEHFHRGGACPNIFETSFSPERKEIVYCEQCYNAEVV